MTRRTGFPVLLRLAEIKAEQARAELARATARCAPITVRLAEMAEVLAAAADGVDDPAKGAALARLQRLNLHRRQALLQDLATLEALRQEALGKARLAEGRKIALRAVIADQAS